MAGRVRRSAFMTPVVLVLGCGHPSPPTEEPRPMNDLDPGYVAAPTPDAGSPPDAEVVAVVPDAPLPADADDVAINWDYDCRNCNPPSPGFYAKIRSISVVGNGLMVTLDKGTDKQVYVGERGYLVDRRGKRIPGSDFTIVSVSERTSRARTEQQFELQGSGVHARFDE